MFDDYTRNIDLIRRMFAEKNNNLQIILAERTPTHLTNRDKLGSGIDGFDPFEIRIDRIGRDDLIVLDGILARAGLLGGLAKLPVDRRIDFLVRQCNSEFCSILIDIMESPEIQERLQAVFDLPALPDDVRRLAIATLALEGVGIRLDVFDLADLIGAEALNHADLSESSVISDILQLHDGVAYSRSSVFASAALRTFWSSGLVLEVLEDLLRKTWSNRFDDKRYNAIAAGLMRYSNIKDCVPRNGSLNMIGQHYDRIRNLPACANNELFWLQVSIFDIDGGNFEKAEAHLSQSYAIASNKKDFDTYQLDNTKANLLLSKEIKVGPTLSSFQNFVEARRIISRQIRDRRHGYYPYRVARLYAGLWPRVVSHWTEGQRKVFFDACRAVLDFVERADADLRAMNDVVRCEEELRAVLASAT